MKKQITEQETWLTGALELHRKTAGKARPRRSYAAQEQADRLIEAAPNVRRIQVFAERLDVQRFAYVEGDRLMYRGREIVPVRYLDVSRPWAGVVPT